MINRYYNNQYRYQTLINIPSQRSYINPLNVRKTFEIKDLIIKAEKGVDTISSVIPLYKKVQPVIEQGKSFVTNLNSFFKKNKKEDKPKVEKVEAEIVEPNNIKQETHDYRTNQTNSKPFFL